MSKLREREKEALQEPIKKRFGGSLTTRTPFERLAMLQRNADALVKDWRGKDDGTHIRNFFGSPDKGERPVGCDGAETVDRKSTSF